MSKKPNKDKQSATSDMLRALAFFSQIGVTMATTVITGVLVGKYLDKIFKTSPWLLLIFSLLGAGAAIKVLFNFSKK